MNLIILDRLFKIRAFHFIKNQFVICLLLLNSIFPLLSWADIHSGSSREKCIKEGVFKNGQCVKIDDHPLYVESFGLPVNTNVPNIVFLPGSGNTHQVWDKVVSQVEKFAHVVTYDRSGYGTSQQYSIPKALTAPLVFH